MQRRFAAELDSDEAARVLLAPAADLQVPQTKRRPRKGMTKASARSRAESDEE